MFITGSLFPPSDYEIAHVPCYDTLWTRSPVCESANFRVYSTGPLSGIGRSLVSFKLSVTPHGAELII